MKRINLWENYKRVKRREMSSVSTTPCCPHSSFPETLTSRINREPGDPLRSLSLCRFLPPFLIGMSSTRLTTIFFVTDGRSLRTQYFYQNFKHW